jgi:SAM-dependent methyltransferase
MTMTAMPRRVEPETLDHLPEDDPHAMRSRRDLRRINRIMGNVGIIDSLLGRSLTRAPSRIAEIGAGDGTLLLRLAARRARAWRGVAVTFVDRQDLVSSETRAGFETLGWTAHAASMDVFDWLERENRSHYDAIVANLFVHHFEPPAVRQLFRAIAGISDCFVACEPRRTRIALLGSNLVGAVGANAVTRRDAVLSVRAGFNDGELSALWPDGVGWKLDERGAGLFSHAFAARRLAA